MKLMLAFIIMLPVQILSCEESKNVKTICSHTWKQKNKTLTTKVTLHQKGCKRFEEGQGEDCYFVQTCETGFQSAPIFKDPESLDYHCNFKNLKTRIVLGADDEVPRSPAIATLKCSLGKVTSIEIKTPDKKSKDCKL